MIKKTAFAPYEDEEYEKFGKETFNKIVEIIKKENIKIINSYEYAIKMSAAYVQDSRYTSPSKKTVSHTILLPAFTDDSYLEQAIVAAHELGHYYVFSKSKKIKSYLLNTESSISTYMNEYLAWKEAKELLISLNIINEKGTKIQQIAYIVFNQKKKEGLNSYPAPFLNLFKGCIKTFKVIVEILIKSYITMGCLFIFQKNDIPTPYIGKLDMSDFSTYVKGLFSTVFSFYVFIKALNIFTKKK